MDILTPIIVLFIFQMSQNIPILHDLLTIIIAFGVIATFWLALLLFFIVATVFTAILWLPQIFKSVYKLGIYHPLISKTGKNSHFGESDSEKLGEVFKANLVVGLSLFFVLLYIFNTIPTSFFESGSYMKNATINQSSSPAENDQFDIKLSNGAFALVMMFVPLFLLSLRIFANPTEDWVKLIIRTDNRSKDEIKTKIRYFKDQVTSYYYSFIVSTIILLYFSMLLMMYINGGELNLHLISPFIPKMDNISIAFFLILEIFVIIITTVLGEWYLKISPPICQD